MGLTMTADERRSLATTLGLAADAPWDTVLERIHTLREREDARAFR